ncbi:phage major capsid protein, P2 family [Ralstonia sp. SM1864_UCD524_TZ4]|uniref:Bacteriophage P2 GPN capsid proteins,Contains Minor capsid protein H1, Minor capsid protein H2,Major capsid protein N n=1 Tax=Ralstonia solanacearum TaxID=305 RepID=A0A0S4UJ30_RALSL|nr:phage major capsid protein, P2 family [Ralstonia pseudosolanacearum]CUV22196.1 Bacteriophage P2 GPN capsid proteins,Contains Minor capsid protein H1, Minor capsid protein H2,Major capsid protein N* [Ralstonia solanacearum]CUV36577.1 Bacteriophage P2 GPN capsid proteins,Contains Minor capsid protein H1, Minor capsid protein H2,Major capsid protein N* [Ralstonia solanacearum]CUV41326.1 Bacteriophage P2 GPN capsid proteins,Contains Minor capsid protein H1, Minor capsid protein H2,Major capsid pr
MQNKTRRLFAAYKAEIAKLNRVDRVDEKFTVDPTVQQRLENKVQESSAFLSKINVYPVTEQEGEKLGLGVSGPVASTTDTTKQDRQTADISTLDGRRYRCEQTNSDTHITYQKLDAWAKFPDFQTRIRDAIIKRQALDRMMIGFNGIKRVATSDRAANPMLQDVNKGWLQSLREQAPQRVMSHDENNADKIIVGAKQNFGNLDAVVFDLVNHLIEPWYAEDPDLVVICGRELLADKYFPLVNVNREPTQTLAADVIMSQKRIGNLPAVRVPYFPPHSLMVTRLDNLSIYYQEGARRRTVVDNARRDRIENYESSNDAYVIEDLGCAAMAENIMVLEPKQPDESNGQAQ